MFFAYGVQWSNIVLMRKHHKLNRKFVVIYFVHVFSKKKRLEGVDCTWREVLNLHTSVDGFFIERIFKHSRKNITVKAQQFTVKIERFNGVIILANDLEIINLI